MIRIKRKFWKGALIFCMSLMLTAGCGQKEEAAPETTTEAVTQQEEKTVNTPEETTEKASEEAPSGILSQFSTTDLEGNARDASVFADYKLTMVNFWATYCGPCISEMPALAEINKEYADQGVQVVGVVVDALAQNMKVHEETAAEARIIVDQTDADYIHLLPNLEFYQRKIQYMIGVPETIFVNSKGEQVGDSYLGAKTKEQWQEIIDVLLEEAE